MIWIIWLETLPCARIFLLLFHFIFIYSGVFFWAKINNNNSTIPDQFCSGATINSYYCIIHLNMNNANVVVCTLFAIYAIIIVIIIFGFGCRINKKYETVPLVSILYCVCVRTFAGVKFDQMHARTIVRTVLDEDYYICTHRDHSGCHATYTRSLNIQHTFFHSLFSFFLSFWQSCSHLYITI